MFLLGNYFPVVSLTSNDIFWRTSVIENPLKRINVRITGPAYEFILQIINDDNGTELKLIAPTGTTETVAERAFEQISTCAPVTYLCFAYSRVHDYLCALEFSHSFEKVLSRCPNWRARRTGFLTWRWIARIGKKCVFGVVRQIRPATAGRRRPAALRGLNITLAATRPPPPPVCGARA